ncbi:MAG: restriction endonuclease subunit S [Methanomethylovorans sp.]|uniref:restriction endonuclease subunit S n=1 Tax=Methanomethylovorans sp. TaxID=2758717 RepID=UPI000AC7E04C
MGKWEMVRLGDVCDVQAGGTPARNNSVYWKDGTIPWVKISDFTRKGVFRTEESITTLGLENSSAKIFPVGTILFTIFATLGEVNILHIEAATNQAIAGININNSDEIDRLFLVNYLISIKHRINDLGRGVAQNNINLSILRNLMIPFPPLEVQQQIADVLDRASALIEKRKVQIDKLDLLVKSQFIEMFGDPVTNPKGWGNEKLDKVAPPTPYRGEVVTINNKYWLLNLDAIKAQSGEILELKLVDKNEIGNSTVSFSADNVLYSKLRPYLNKVVNVERSGYATTELVPLFPEKNKLNKEFLTALLRSDEFVSYINGKVAGAKMPRVNMVDLRNFKIILPSINLQNQFASFVQQVEAQKSLFQESLTKLELNYKSLMQKCFNGEIF